MLSSIHLAHKHITMMQQSQLPRLPPLKAHWGPSVQWFPAFQGEPMVQYLLHAGCPCSFPTGEHVQDSKSCYLFKVSDLQLFPGTKKFKVMSSVNMLLMSPREVHQSECIALTVLGWTSKAAVNPLPLFTKAFTFFLSTCLPPVIQHTGKWRMASTHIHLTKKPLYRLSLCLHTNKRINTLHHILPQRTQIMLASVCRVLNLYPRVLNNYPSPNLLWFWVSIHITQQLPETSIDTQPG